MNWRLLEKASPTRIQGLFGLFPRALSELLAAVLPVLVERRRQTQQRRPDRQRAVGGGRIRRLAPYQEVLLTLLYLRHNVSHEVVGAFFGVSADTSENTFHEVIGVLQQVCPSSRWEAEKRWQKGQPSWQPTERDRLLIDSFETPIRRPSDETRQRRTYSGKKKRHTLKTQVVTDAKGEILEIDPGHRGPKADLRIYEESGVDQRYPDAEKTADKG
ncbi:MAG: transposase family protein, partial [candidate division NC10 bacterium]